MNHVAGEVGGHPAAVAISRVRDIVKDSSGTPLWSASDSDLTEMPADAMQAQSQFAAMVLQMIAEADRRDDAKRAGAASTAAWLRHRFTLAPAEAKKQTCLAAALDRTLHPRDAQRRRPDRA